MMAPHLAHPDVSLLRLGLRLANFDYLLPAIRLKGNAYGAGASYESTLGTLSLYSYRDPNIVETLNTFAGLRAYIDSHTWSQLDIDRAIIGCAKDAETPIRPGAATGTALLRYLRGDTNAQREQRHAAMLKATPATVKEATLRVLDANLPHAAICVVSSRKKLDAANKRLGNNTLSLSDILP